MSNKNDHDIYIIPPNFIETGTFFGGMFRARNVIEAGILALAIGTPVFLCLPFGLTARIIALCLTALPVALVALIGISGESLSQFLITFLKYLRNRRVVGGDGEQPCEKTAPSKSAGKHLKQKPPKERKPKAPKRRRSGEADFPAEFDEVRGYEIREKLRPKKNAKKDRPAKGNKAKKNAKKRHEKERLPKRPARVKEQKPACLNPVADYLPIEKVENGIIYTKDHRFVKVVEVVPINFMLRSAREQRNIIYSFVSYLKISPIKLQIKVLTRRADINRHLDTVRQEMAHEENEQCRLMQEDYLNFVQQVGSREAVTRRFFLIFEYEPWANTRRSEQEDEAIQSLQSAVHTASNYLRQCGNEVVVHENEDEFTVDVFYNLLCRNESAVKPLSVRAQEIVAQYLDKGREGEIDRIPAAEFAAPKSIDFTHGRYSLYKQASDTVRSGVIIGLGSRLQVFQSELIKKITTRDEIDLELPGQERCAYFLVTSDQDSTFDFLASLFLSFCFIKLVRYADKNCEGGKLPVPVHVLGEELTACGTIPDLSRRLSVIRSRNISMSCVFQNLAGLQNRYPLNLWQEILGNCDAQLFLGCTDELTAEFISSRTGLASVSVSSKSKQLGTWRISNYTPEYRETSGVGKRPVLTPDEVLRLPIKQALVIIRGQKVLKVDKMDYSKHPEASKLRSCKASAHIPEWRRLEQEQPKPSAAQPKPQAPAPKKPVKKKPKAASTSTNTKQTAAVPTAEAPNGIITTDKDSILS